MMFSQRLMLLNRFAQATHTLQSSRITTQFMYDFQKSRYTGISEASTDAVTRKASVRKQSSVTLPSSRIAHEIFEAKMITLNEAKLTAEIEHHLSQRPFHTFMSTTPIENDIFEAKIASLNEARLAADYEYLSQRPLHTFTFMSPVEQEILEAKLATLNEARLMRDYAHLSSQRPFHTFTNQSPIDQELFDAKIATLNQARLMLNYADSHSHRSLHTSLNDEISQAKTEVLNHAKFMAKYTHLSQINDYSTANAAKKLNNDDTQAEILDAKKYTLKQEKLTNNFKQVTRKQRRARRSASEVSVGDDAITGQVDIPVYPSVDWADGKPVEKIPSPGGVPWFGQYFDFCNVPFTDLPLWPLKQKHESLTARYKELGPIWRETFLGATIVHVVHPDYFKTVFKNEIKTPTIDPLQFTGKMYREKMNMSVGLGNLNGEEWYHLRHAVNKLMLRPKEIMTFLPLSQPVALEFVEQVVPKYRDTSNKNVLSDLTRHVMRWQLESSTVTGYENRAGHLSDAAITDENSRTNLLIKANLDTFELSTKLCFSIPFFKYINTPNWKKLCAAEDYYFGYYQQQVDDTISRIKELVDSGKFEPGSYRFMTYLLNRKELDYKEVSIIALSLSSDGMSTIVAMLLWSLYCLSYHPRVQDKVFEEIQTVLTKSPANGSEPVYSENFDCPLRNPVASDFQHMPYLRAFIKEVFRFFPIGPDIKRIADKDYMLAGYQIKKGTRIELNPIPLLMDPQYFQDPLEFMPERWLRDGSAHNVHPYQLLSFGHGPRMCIGRRFAEQDLHQMITLFLRRYHLTWHDDQPLGRVYRLLFWPDRELSVGFSDRHYK